MWPRQSRCRRRLIAGVRENWVDPCLLGSLWETGRLDVKIQYRPDLLASSISQLALMPASEGEEPFFAGRSRQEPSSMPLSFETVCFSEGNMTVLLADAQGQLVLLGASGAGKTSLSHAIALELLDRAELNPVGIVPVVFSLPGWMWEGGSLSGWMVWELRVRYQIPFYMGRKWVESNSILPIFEGFERIPPAWRSACAKEVNDGFCKTERPFILTCETSTYQELLAIGAGVETLTPPAVIVPLDRTDLRDALERIPAFSVLSDVLSEKNGETENVLWEVLRTPLMAHIALTVFQKNRLLSFAGMSVTEASQTLWEAFVACKPSTTAGAYSTVSLPRTSVASQENSENASRENSEKVLVAGVAREVDAITETDVATVTTNTDCAPDMASPALAVSELASFELPVSATARKTSAGSSSEQRSLPHTVLGVKTPESGTAAPKISVPAKDVRDTTTARGREQRWVSWVAWVLSDHCRTDFAPEHLRLDWVAPAQQRRAYLQYHGIFSLCVGASLGLVAGLRAGVLAGVLFGMSAVFLFLLVCLVGLLWHAAPQEPPLIDLNWPFLCKKKNLGTVVGLALAAGLVIGAGDFSLVPALSLLSLAVGGLVFLLSGNFARMGGAFLPGMLRRSGRRALFLAAVFGVIVQMAGSFLHTGSFPMEISLCLAVAIFFLAGGAGWVWHWLLRYRLQREKRLPRRLGRALEKAVEDGLMVKKGGSYFFFHEDLQDYLAAGWVVDPSHAP